MTILLTRPQASSEALAARLAPLPCLIAPVMRIAPVETLPPLDAEELVFTSAAAVRVFAALSDRRDLPVWCVGARCAEAAMAVGMKAQTADGDLASLDALLEAEKVARGGLVHLSGTYLTGELPGVRSIPIYDQPALPPDLAALATLAEGAISTVPLYSPRSAALLMDWIGDAPDGDPLYLAMSPAVAAKITKKGARIGTIDRPEGWLMEEAIREAASR
ncbi:uroporphyrinogen-III synthase [Paracoccaceae bacterium GXU_MW_L88]